MGPFYTKSLRGSSYVLTLIDEFSMMNFGYLLKNKYQTFEMFKEFKALVENKTNLRIKMLGSNNGSEIISNELNDLNVWYGIKRKFIVPYNP